MSISLILDCGATNVRAIAIDQQGQIIANAHQANQTTEDPQHKDYQIWDFEQIVEKLFACAKHVCQQLREKQLLLEWMGHFLSMVNKLRQ